MKAVILAAGKGSRLGTYTKGKPKCLLKLGSETILQREIRILQTCGIHRNEIYVVGGYRHELLRNDAPNLIINNDYEKKDNSYSLGLALKYVCDDNILILDADLCFEEELIYEILADEHENVLMSRKSKDLEESTGIVTSENRRVEAIGKEYVDTGYVYISIFKIAKQIIPEFRDRLLSRRSERTWYPNAITELCSDYMFYNHVTMAKWHEIDFVKAYLETLQMFGLKADE